MDEECSLVPRTSLSFKKGERVKRRKSGKKKMSRKCNEINSLSLSFAFTERERERERENRRKRGKGTEKEGREKEREREGKEKEGREKVIVLSSDKPCIKVILKGGRETLCQRKMFLFFVKEVSVCRKGKSEREREKYQREREREERKDKKWE